MFDNLFTIPLYLLFVIIVMVIVSVSDLKKSVKALKKELEQTKEWLRQELYENQEKIEKEK
jgi:predicted Holliday junction resolvase-like endonuclease